MNSYELVTNSSEVMLAKTIPIVSHTIILIMQLAVKLYLTSYVDRENIKIKLK